MFKRRTINMAINNLKTLKITNQMPKFIAMTFAIYKTFEVQFCLVNMYTSRILLCFDLLYPNGNTLCRKERQSFS